ncbi:MAG: FG-GAP repeat protein, partial [Balneolaceae bacterium]
RDGHLERADLRQAGLDSTCGWWQSLALADLNGNGRLDLIAGNHGLNSRFRVSTDRPVEMWAGDFDRNGTFEQVFSAYSDEGAYLLPLRHNMLQQFPFLRPQYESYASYRGETITDVFTQEQLDRTVHHRAEQLASIIGWNNGEGRFNTEQLPFRAQLAPIYSILAEDLNGDRIPELLLGGNLHAVQPQMGSYDASYGTVLQQDSYGIYREVPSKVSGFHSPGEIRSIHSLRSGGQNYILTARSNQPLQVFKAANPIVSD